MDFLIDKLKELKESGLFRDLKTVEGAQEPFLKIDGKRYLSFCSNNYLGLASHPKVMQAATEAIEKYGWGAGASRLVSGNTALHERLEEEIALFKHTEDSIVFPTGYMANIGAICSLVSQGDIVIGDILNHASIVDGCRQSGATFRFYPHCDMNKLEHILRKASEYRKRLIVTDSVFSMDGDIAPLPEIVDLAQRYNAMTMIDEAHGTGVFGKGGRGVAEHFNLEGRIDVVMGTLSKAMGSLGGFVAGSRDLAAYLRNRARSFMYTTALPPAVCAASIAALRLIQEEPSLREMLWRNASCVEEGLKKIGLYKGVGAYCNTPMLTQKGPIFPIIIGESRRALEVSNQLFEENIFIPAIRPPTVPEGTSRLRLTVMSTHTPEHIHKLIDALSNNPPNPPLLKGD
ncbi:MAG: 8-amino-7-oxononanoate synthase [Candidatus Brocadiales bacterium]